MCRIHLRKIIIILLFLSGQYVYSQQAFEVLVDSSEYYTEIPTETGRPLKFLASHNRLVVLDYENYRVLFYQRGETFDDNRLSNGVYFYTFSTESHFQERKMLLMK